MKNTLEFTYLIVFIDEDRPNKVMDLPNPLQRGDELYMDDTKDLYTIKTLRHDIDTTMARVVLKDSE